MLFPVHLFYSYLNKRFEELRREKLIVNSRRKKRYSFDDYCLICGKHLFTFCCFLHRGEECVSCEHYCCTSCREVLVVKDEQNTEQFYICNLCVNKRWDTVSFLFFFLFLQDDDGFFLTNDEKWDLFGERKKFPHDIFCILKLKLMTIVMMHFDS